jgi:hypothetical protein
MCHIFTLKRKSEIILKYKISNNLKACQWSWGEEPVAPELDPEFPKGCLSNCPTRSELKEMENMSKKGTICNQ